MIRHQDDTDSRTLREKRNSPSMQVRPFGVERNELELVNNQLDVSGVHQDGSQISNEGGNPQPNYMENTEVDDQVIEDIQKRLELLDEFK